MMSTLTLSDIWNMPDDQIDSLYDDIEDLPITNNYNYKRLFVARDTDISQEEQDMINDQLFLDLCRVNIDSSLDQLIRLYNSSKPKAALKEPVRRFSSPRLPSPKPVLSPRASLVPVRVPSPKPVVAAPTINLLDLLKNDRYVFTYDSFANLTDQDLDFIFTYYLSMKGMPKSEIEKALKMLGFYVKREKIFDILNSKGKFVRDEAQFFSAQDLFIDQKNNALINYLRNASQNIAHISATLPKFHCDVYFPSRNRAARLGVTEEKPNKIEMLIDTGADSNVISYDAIKRFGLEDLIDGGIKQISSGIGGTVFGEGPIRYIELAFGSSAGPVFPVNLLVQSGEEHNIIGLGFLLGHGIEIKYVGVGQNYHLKFGQTMIPLKLIERRA